MNLEEAIEAQDRGFEAAFVSGDFDSVVTLHKDATMLLPPDGPMLTADREGVIQALKDAYDQGFRNYRLESIEFDSSGDLAYNVGRTTAEVSVNGDSHTVTGKTVDIYKRNADGDWELHLTIWNNDEPVSE